jgi:hypothetical protein
MIRPGLVPGRENALAERSSGGAAAVAGALPTVREIVLAPLQQKIKHQAAQMYAGTGRVGKTIGAVVKTFRTATGVDVFRPPVPATCGLECTWQSAPRTEVLSCWS